MNIYRFELKMISKSMFIWTAGIAFFIVIYMVFYPTMMVDNEAFEQVMANFPEEFLAFFGMNGDLPFTSLLGYYALTMSFVYIPIGIQAAHYGISILSIEERELTADFLLTKPVSRSTIFLSKFAAALTALLLTNLMTWIASIVSLFAFNAGQEVVLDHVYLILTSLIILQLFFLSVGMMISVMVKKIDSVISYSIGLGFGLFIVSSFGDMLSNRVLQLIGIYSHYDPVAMLVDGSFDWSKMWLSIVVAVTAFVAGYVLYQRRNIKSL